MSAPKTKPLNSESAPLPVVQTPSAALVSLYEVRGIAKSQMGGLNAMFAPSPWAVVLREVEKAIASLGGSK